MAQAKSGGDAKLALAAALALVVVALIIDDVTIAWFVAPFFLLLSFYAIARATLRDTMLVLMFFGLVLENPAEVPGAGLWKSAFYPFGKLMLTHLKTSIGTGFIGGMDMLLIAAIIVAIARRGQGTALDRRNRLGTPRPMIHLAYLSLATTAFVFVVGKLRGGGDQSMALWQMDRVMYLPILFLLFQAALVGPKDHIAVGKVILVAGTLRSLQALYVKWTVVPPIDPQTGERHMAYATTHNDSMLFALASVLLAALLIQRVGKRATRVSLLLIPILASGMVANNRRMVWVQVILVLATVFFMTESNPVKRKLTRILVYLSPFIAGYVVAGWNSKAGIFKPVQTIRSAVDPATDSSTLWREIENYNLIFTIRQYPFFGTGYGHGFWEVLPLPPINYSLERFIPHNSILGLWCYTGYFGYVGLTSLWVAGVYLGVRAYHHCTAPIDKAAAMVSFAAVLVYLVQCFGDMGLGSWTGVFTVAPALAVACKLAVANGAWLTSARPPSTQPVSQAGVAGEASSPSV